jgi:hypothetical protein
MMGLGKAPASLDLSDVICEAVPCLLVSMATEKQLFAFIFLHAF